MPAPTPAERARLRRQGKLAAHEPLVDVIEISRSEQVCAVQLKSGKWVLCPTLEPLNGLEFPVPQDFGPDRWERHWSNAFLIKLGEPVYDTCQEAAADWWRLYDSGRWR